MSDRICANCRHWVVPEPAYSGRWEGLKVCNSAEELWLFTESYEHADGDDCKRLSAKAAGRRAFVEDGSDYHAALLTRPDFGCVEFSSKIGV